MICQRLERGRKIDAVPFKLGEAHADIPRVWAEGLLIGRKKGGGEPQTAEGFPDGIVGVFIVFRAEIVDAARQGKGFFHVLNASPA